MKEILHRELKQALLNGYCKHAEGKNSTIDYDLRVLKMAISMSEKIQVNTIRKSAEAQKTLKVINSNKTAKRLAGQTFISILRRRFTFETEEKIYAVTISKEDIDIIMEHLM